MHRNFEELIAGRDHLNPDALVIVLIGASAAGKSTIADRLCDSGAVEATPTWTTRPPRPGESDTSYDHRFASDEEFDRYGKDGGFMDQRVLYGFRYGVPFLTTPPEGKEALMVLKPLFIPRFIEHFPAARIYQIGASLAEIGDRMKARGQDQEDIDGRLEVYEAETAEAQSVAHVIIDNNGPLDRTVAQVGAQIRLDRQAHDDQWRS